VYIYLDPRKGLEPFYVGKGIGNRAESHLLKSHNREMNFKISKMRKDGVKPVINKLLMESESNAFLYEIKLIKEFGRKDLKTGTLLNRTDGGDGVSGAIISEETRLRWSAERKANPNYRGHIRTVEHRHKISESLKGRHPSEETLLKLKNRPKRPGKIGLKASEETIQKCREANIGRQWWNFNGESRFNVESPGPEWKLGRTSFKRRTNAEITAQEIQCS
jgi:hypothetical protein